MLINKGIIKTEMRKQAGISTNMFAKICTTRDCSIDDIVEITNTQI